MRKRSGPNTKHLPKGLEIIHEDSALLVVDKPQGLLTVSTEKEKSRTAYFALTDYVRKGNARSKKRIFIVHRLDRDTSGVIVFAKTEEAKIYLQGHWKESTKKYLSVVHGRFDKQSDIISSYLAENKAQVMYSTTDTEKGKLARTAYRVLKERGDYSLLEIELLTGRKNQIRVHLAEKGHPVVGDRKYGDGNQSKKPMALHALSISIRHPDNGRFSTFSTQIPKYFETFVGSLGQAVPQSPSLTLPDPR